MGKQIYLIVDASSPFCMGKKIEEAINSGISRLQLFNAEKCAEEHLLTISRCCKRMGVKLYIYNNASIAEKVGAEGVHFDELPDNFQEESSLKVGLTVGNDLEKLVKAEQKGVDYISFCSVFPTRSANVCTLVDIHSIRRAHQHFSGEIFLAGGISEHNIPMLKGLDFDGIAVISEIVNAEDVTAKIEKLKHLLA